jgi:uncharacterized protein YegL
VIARDNHRERQREAEAEGQRNNAVTGKARLDMFHDSLTQYQQLYLQHSDRIEDAYIRLRDLFMPTLCARQQKGLPSGTDVDIDAAARFEYTGEGVDRLFMSYTRPAKPDVGIVLVVDCSKSMEGERIETAKQSVVFTRELFSRLGMPVACVTFSDEAHVVAAFEEEYDDARVNEQLLASITAQGSTNDAAALLSARTLVEEHYAECHAVIMISDAGSNDPAPTRKEVEHLRAGGVQVLHFGIGEGTSDSEGTYDRSFGDLEISDDAMKGFFPVFCGALELLAEELY